MISILIKSMVYRMNRSIEMLTCLSPLIYGIGTGLFNRTSIQLPTLIRAALKRGKAEMIGPGESTWDHVHISDLVDGYIVLLDQFLAAYGPNTSANAQISPYLTTGREGYYFAENGRHSTRRIQLARRGMSIEFKSRTIT